MAEVEQQEVTADAEPQVEEKTDGGQAHVEVQPEMETMRTIVLTGYGGYSKLQVQKYAKPKPMKGQVVVRVHACGLNFADIMQRQGQYPSPKKPPFIPGLECAGVVEELGEDVTGLEVGSRVACLTMDGAWSEFTCIPAVSCHVMPDSMSFEEGAALLVQYLTAYYMLFHCANLGKRKTILIHMAAGGVGVAATQLCKTVEGVTTFGTASASKHDMILENGITHAIDYRTMDYVQAVKKVCPEGIDIVLDPLGGADTKKGYHLLRSLGIIVCFGYANAVTESKSVLNVAKNWWQGASFNPLTLLKDSKTVCGFDLKQLRHHPQLLKEGISDLFRLYEEGKIKPHIDETFAFEEVGKAMQRMHERKNIGKVILSPLKEPKSDSVPQPPVEPAGEGDQIDKAEKKPEEGAEGEKSEEEPRPSEEKDKEEAAS